jgi:cullin 1
MRKECEVALISKHKDRIIAECETYLKSSKLDDLSRMYRLLSRLSDGIRQIGDILQAYVTHTGLEAVKGIPIVERVVGQIYIKNFKLKVHRNPKLMLKHSCVSMFSLVI